MNKALDSGDWQVKCEKVSHRLLHLFRSKLWTDCTFLVGYEETETISAHKFVLAMSSPVFEVMFYGGMPEGEGPIAVTDVHPEIFKKLLGALYSDKLKIESYREASELYYAAKKYMLPHIQKLCLNHMQSKLEPKTACYALEFATMFDESQLMNAALKTIIRQTKEVLKDSSFEDVNLKVILKIFSQERLDLDSELDLYYALDRYAKAHGVTVQGINPEALEAKRPRIDENPENIENESESPSKSPGEGVKKEPTEEKMSIHDIREALFLIRFRTLTGLEFAHALNSSTLLTDDEALAILQMLMHDQEPYPERFTKRKDMRVPICEPEIISPAAGLQFEAICMFSVYNFKTRKRAVCSERFYTNKVGWTVHVVPGHERRENGMEQKVLGVQVQCEGENGRSDGHCVARVRLEVTAVGGRNLQRTYTHIYTSARKSFGYNNLMTWDAVCDPVTGFLKGNTLQVNVKVAAGPMTYDDKMCK